MLRPAVFLDRDGTLIEDVGILSDPADICLYSDTLPTLAALQKHYLLFVVTNQNGIAKGLITPGQVEAVNAALDARLRQDGITIQRWYVCPHHRRDECRCIKPNPAFLLEAARDYDIDLPASFVIGDHPHDPATADAVGATGLYVLTGHGTQHADQLPPGRHLFETLAQAGDWIITQMDVAPTPRRGKPACSPVKTTIIPLK